MSVVSTLGEAAGGDLAAVDHIGAVPRARRSEPTLDSSIDRTPGHHHPRWPTTVIAKADVESAALDDVFASTPMVARAPSSHFPVPERDPRDIFQLVQDELMLDGVARMNLATFCTTWVSPARKKPW